MHKYTFYIIISIMILGNSLVIFLGTVIAYINKCPSLQHIQNSVHTFYISSFKRKI